MLARFGLPICNREIMLMSLGRLVMVSRDLFSYKILNEERDGWPAIGIDCNRNVILPTMISKRIHTICYRQ